MKQGDKYIHKKTNRIVLISSISTGSLIVKYQSPRGTVYESPIVRFISLYKPLDLDSIDQDTCRHQWTEVLLFTNTIKFCVKCDKEHNA